MPTELQRLNQVRWNKVGQLLRTAELLNAMIRQYPRMVQSYPIYGAVDALKEQAYIINTEYAIIKKRILDTRLIDPCTFD